MFTKTESSEVDLVVATLNEMVEQQLDEVAGGGYRQTMAHYFKMSDDGTGRPIDPS